EGLRMAEELHLWPEVAIRHAWLGWVAMQRGRFPEARAYARQALNFTFPHSQVFAEIVLGLTARYEGDMEDAEYRLRALLKATRPEDGAQPPLFMPLIYVGLGHTAELRGDLEQAFGLHREALAIGIQIEGPRDMAFSLEGMASVLSLTDHAEPAARFLGAAMTIRRESGMTPGPSERSDIGRAESRLREALSEKLEPSLTEGSGLTAEQCLAQAEALTF
ncbi:tetratricopeptide repeat protein, partial [Actinomadura adrarensis]